MSLEPNGTTRSSSLVYRILELVGISQLPHQLAECKDDESIQACVIKVSSEVTIDDIREAYTMILTIFGADIFACVIPCQILKPGCHPSALETIIALQPTGWQEAIPEVEVVIPEGSSQEVPGGSDTKPPLTKGRNMDGCHQTSSTNDKKSWNLAVGGTFDGLHAGHLLLLTTCCKVVQEARDGTHNRILVGICEDEVLHRKEYAKDVGYSYLTREGIVRSALQFMLESMGWERLSEIRDSVSKEVLGMYSGRPQGIALRDGDRRVDIITTPLDKGGVGVAGELEELNGLVVTPETMRGGEVVNNVRKSKGMRVLELIICPLVFCDSLKGKLSSRDIRKKLMEDGEMEINGDIVKYRSSFHARKGGKH